MGKRHFDDDGQFATRVTPLDFRFRHCHFSRLRKRPDRQGNQRGLRHPPPFRLRFNQLHRFRRQLEVFLHDTAFLIASLLDFRS